MARPRLSPTLQAQLRAENGKCRSCRRPIDDERLVEYGRCAECIRPLLAQLGSAGSNHRSRVRRYALTIDEFAELWKKQNGRCAICLTSATDVTDLQIDHDHASGDVRGLLCRGCNIGLGNFQDDVKRLGRAASYLDKER